MKKEIELREFLKALLANDQLRINHFYPHGMDCDEWIAALRYVLEED